MVNADNDEFKPMEWLPENVIDNKLFRLIDPEQPLHKDDIFLPSINFTMIEILMLGFWFCLCIVSVVSLSYQLIDKVIFTLPGQESKGPPTIILIILFLIFSFSAFETWKALRSMLIRRRLFKEGRYRNGMFILKDAILLHTMAQIFFVEKKYISHFHILPKGRGESPELLMVIKKSEDERFYINLFKLDLEHNAYTLNKSLVNWINTGKWEIKEAASVMNMPEIKK